MNFLRFITVFTLAVCSASAHAVDQFEDTGSGMIEACRMGLAQVESKITTAKAGQCYGEVRSLLLWSDYLSGRLHFCPPASVIASDAMHVVVDYMDHHPERLTQPFTLVAWEAMSMQWPCSSRGFTQN